MEQGLQKRIIAMVVIVLFAMGKNSKERRRDGKMKKMIRNKRKQMNAYSYAFNNKKMDKTPSEKLHSYFRYGG